MDAMRAALSIAAIVTVMSVSGCGSVTSGASGAAGTSGGVGGTVSAGGRGGAGGAAGTSGASGAVGSGGAVGGAGGAPACYNGLTISSNFVMAQPGREGIAQGGVIEDGIYDLTANWYGGPAMADVPFQAVTIRVTGNVLDTVSMLSTDPAPTYRSYTFTPQDTRLMRTTTCGTPTGTVTYGYTTTATTLQIMSTDLRNGYWNSVATYTKR